MAAGKYEVTRLPEEIPDRDGTTVRPLQPRDLGCVGSGVQAASWCGRR
jgi:hypothetical protein